MMWYHGGGVGHLDASAATNADEPEISSQPGLNDSSEHESDAEPDGVQEQGSDADQAINDSQPDLDIDDPENSDNGEEQEAFQDEEEIEYESEEDMEPLQYEY